MTSDWAMGIVASFPAAYHDTIATPIPSCFATSSRQNRRFTHYHPRGVDQHPRGSLALSRSSHEAALSHLGAWPKLFQSSGRDQSLRRRGALFDISDDLSTCTYSFRWAFLILTPHRPFGSHIGKQLPSLPGMKCVVPQPASRTPRANMT
jgi:hypothetical protein